MDEKSLLNGYQLIRDGGPYREGTSYMIGTYIIKEFNTHV